VFDVIRRILDIPPEDIKKAKVRRDLLAPPPITTFKGIDPTFLYDYDGWFFKLKDYTPDIVWPVDVCIISPKAVSGGLQVMRFRTIAPKEVRGIVHRISPFMLRVDVGAELDSEIITAAVIMSYLGGKWSRAEKVRGEDPPDFIDQGNIAIGIALRQRYEWAVNIGFENTPSARIVTDPTGMKELFRLRDVAPGRDRRDMLMNWVSDHWRQDRRDDDVETYVRKHLRGGTKFDWRGMECEIIPARFDIEQRDRFIAERENMRRSGSDKRSIEVSQ
jgi:hypothetical protein